MKIALTFRMEPGYLIIEAQGNWTAASATEAIAVIHQEVTRADCTQMLLDARGVSKPDYEYTRFTTGQRWAETFDSRFKTACISRPENYNGFGETVALNRGADVKVFFEEAEALAWLLGKPKNC